MQYQDYLLPETSWPSPAIEQVKTAVLLSQLQLIWQIYSTTQLLQLQVLFLPHAFEWLQEKAATSNLQTKQVCNGIIQLLFVPRTSGVSCCNALGRFVCLPQTFRRLKTLPAACKNIVRAAGKGNLVQDLAFHATDTAHVNNFFPVLERPPKYSKNKSSQQGRQNIQRHLMPWEPDLNRKFLEHNEKGATTQRS